MSKKNPNQKIISCDAQWRWKLLIYLLKSQQPIGQLQRHFIVLLLKKYLRKKIFSLFNYEKWRKTVFLNFVRAFRREKFFLWKFWGTHFAPFPFLYSEIFICDIKKNYLIRIFNFFSSSFFFLRQFLLE